MLLSQVKQINPLLNPKPVELGIGSYAGTEGSQANTNLSNISNVLPFALPMATMGLISQAPNIINKEISAQDVIDNHLNRDYKTYEGGYNINEASIYTPQGVIHQPDPVDPETLEEWKRRNILSTPIYEPNIDDYSTGGDQPEINIPNSTGSPPVDLNLPTHTGSPPVEANIPNILYNKDLEEVIDDGLLSETAPPFYSKITKTIEDAQMNKASGDGWMGMINNSGVNQDELDWIGMKDFLADKKSVTKEEILDFARMNDLSTEVKEVILSDNDSNNISIKLRHPLDEQLEDMGLEHLINNPLMNAETIEDAKVIIMNDEGLYNEFLDGMHSTTRERFLNDDLIDDAADNEIKDFLEQNYEIGTFEVLNNTTKFHQGNLITEGDYTDYKEMTFALPNMDADFTGGHYKDKNIFAHARFNTRDIDGKKTLFIEELQSDWVHKGKEVGFKTGEERTYDEIVATSPDAVKVPNLPFKKNWQDIVLKRMIRYAAENGFDAIAMTGGNIQKDRYDLSKHIDSIQVKASDKAEGKIHVVAGNEINLHIYPNQLEEHIGKDLAKKINNDIEEKNIFKNFNTAVKEFENFSQELSKKYDVPANHNISMYGTLKGIDKEEILKYDELQKNYVEYLKGNNLEYKGLDLQVGGEGLGQMYDKIFNKSLKKIGKKHGAEVELKNLSNFQEKGYHIEDMRTKEKWHFETYNELYEFVTDEPDLNKKFIDWIKSDLNELDPVSLLDNANQDEKNSYIHEFFTSSAIDLNEGNDYKLELKTKNYPSNMWYMNLTDSLKKQSIEAGMPIAFNKPVNPLFNYA